MVKKLNLSLEYGCYPVWLLDEDDNIIDTLLPEELRNDHELDTKFADLQARYEATFINDGHVFEGIGFKTKEEEDAFRFDWQQVVEELIEKTKGNYVIVDDIGHTFC